MLFGVLPLAPLTYHWYHWLQTVFTTGSIFCRRSGAWAKRTTREIFVIKMEGLKNLRAETSGITTIFPIQMTLNNKCYILLMTEETIKYISDRSQRKHHTDIKNLIVDETTQLHAMPF